MQRIQKIIANNTDISRRKAEILIEEGAVTLNGVVATIGQSASEDDVIAIDGKPLQVSQKYYIIFHKPKEVVCSKVGEHTVYDYIPPKYLDAGVVSVGRLDKDAEGLILLSNDGTWANSVSHPSTHVAKTYRVWVERKLESRDAKELSAEIKLDEGMLKPISVKISPFGYAEVVVSVGWHKVVKRLFAAHGFRVKKLLRVKIGQLTLPDSLKAGDYRELSIANAQLAIR